MSAMGPVLHYPLHTGRTEIQAAYGLPSLLISSTGRRLYQAPFWLIARNLLVTCSAWSPIHLPAQFQSSPKPIGTGRTEGSKTNPVTTVLGLNKPTKELIETMTLTPKKVPLERRDREGWMRVKSKNSVFQ